MTPMLGMITETKPSISTLDIPSHEYIGLLLILVASFITLLIFIGMIHQAERRRAARKTAPEKGEMVLTCARCGYQADWRVVECPRCRSNRWK